MRPGAPSRALAVALLAATAYAGSLGGDFVFDDASAILDNPVVAGAGGWTDAFRRDFWGRSGRDSTGTWRPLATLSLRLDFRAGGGSPRMFHATNVALHAAVSAIAYVTFRAIAAEEAALGGALLFAVFAAPSEAVDSIVGRADLLLALFVLLGFVAHLRARPGAAALALLAATLCKETAIFAPVAWLLAGPPEGRRLRTVVLYGSALAAAAGIRLAGSGNLHVPHVDPMRNPLVAAAALPRLFGAGRIFARFTLPGLVDPSRRLYACSAPACGASGPGDLLAWAGVLSIVGLVAAAVILRRRAAGLTWFLVFFLPISNFVVPALSYGERLLYVPCLGLCLAIAAAVLALPRRAVAVAALTALAAGNAAALQLRHRDWRSRTDLYLSGLRVAPDSAQVQQNAAVAYYLLHDAASAAEHAQRSLELWPGDPNAETVLALALDKLGHGDQPAALLAHAFAASGYQVDIAADYARFLDRHGERGQALAVIRRARAAHPDSLSLLPLERALSRAAAAAPGAR